MKKWGFVFWLKWHFWRYLVLRTLYNEVLLLDTSYLILFYYRTLNSDWWMKKWGFVVWLKWHFWRYLVQCNLVSCISALASLSVLLLDTNYLILFLISNAELRLMNEEVGICVLTQMTLLKVLGTLYFVLRTMKSCFLYLGSCFLAYLVPCTWYFVQWNEVLLLDTNYLILFLISNDELRSKNEEVGICGLTQMALLKVLGTLYLVLCTMKSCYLILTTWYFF
jgi:hypothetical protein